jgi:hypothetical protein
MIQLLRLLCGALIGLLRSSARREAEILVLRHQINVLRRKSPNRAGLSNVDCLLFVLLSQLVPSTLDALTVVRPATKGKTDELVTGLRGLCSTYSAIRIVRFSDSNRIGSHH